jgi:hypothetical protein
MATKNIVDQMTALEVARRSSDPDAFTIIETMSMTNSMLQELPAVMANDGAIHTSVKRLSYPGGEHRVYNQGIGSTASQTEVQHDIISLLEAFSDVDEALARHSGNPSALYRSEASAFLAGMGLNQADDLIYGNNAQNPAEINGLATRLPLVDGKHCFDFIKETTGTAAPAGSDYTSLYLIAAGPQACHLIYPKGSNSAGVKREDLGVNRVNDKADGDKTFMAHTDHFIAEYGLAIEHPDAAIRIANIPMSLTKPQRLELVELALRLQYKLTRGIVNTMIFANGQMKYQLERAGREAQVIVYPDTDIFGKPIVSLNGLKIREQEAILPTEEKVAAA